MPRKISQQTFWFKGSPLKVIFNKHLSFDDNLSVTHVFIKTNFRAADPAPPSPSHPLGWAGGGGEVALFSHKPWLWL
jgi:hypothetical protein